MTSLHNRFSNALDAAVKASEDRQIIYGLMGVPTATGHTFASPQAGFVRVREHTKNGPAPTEARNDAGVPLRYDLPIKMRRDEIGTLVIIGIDNTGGVGSAATSSTTTANPSGVPVHHHRSVAGADNTANPQAYVLEAKMVDRGRVYSAGGMSVTIAAIRYPHLGGSETYAGGTFDLTTYKPATSGHHAWVLVGINPATNAVVAVTGTSVVYATALAYADLDAIAFGDYIPLAAIKVRNDDTLLTDITDYEDAKHWLGAHRYVDLVDTPTTRTGKAGYLVQVNSGETADEYADLWVKLNAAVVIAEDGNLVTHEGEIVWAI